MSKKIKIAVVDGIIDSITAFFTSNSSNRIANKKSKSSEIAWLKEFEKLTYNNKKNILNSIIKSQEQGIIASIANKHDVSIPQFGAIKIKLTRKELIEYEQSLLQEANVTSKYDLSDEEQLLLSEKMSTKARQIIMNKKQKDTHGFVVNSIVNNFIKKSQ